MSLRRLFPILAAFCLTGCVEDLLEDDDTSLAAAIGNDAPAIEQEDLDPQPEPPVVEEPTPVFVDAEVDHPFFPLRHGSSWVLEGEDDGDHRIDRVRVLDERTLLDGVLCTAVHQEVFLEGELSEMTTEWYALDDQGNIWKFGEESLELEDGVFVLTDDSWQAGVDGATPWMTFGAAPQIGDLYVENRADGDELRVLSLSTTIDVPAGEFDDCLEAIENALEPDDTDILIYAPGVGLVSEVSGEGYIELVSYNVPPK